MSNQGAVPLGLAQQKVARPIDPEQLELMGKRAAARFRDGGTNLSQAVVETVKEARLAPEQIKRVCEFANTTAYLEAFEKAGEMRNITFDGGPADPSVVFKDLNDGSSPAIHQTGDIDYGTPTGSYKTASAEGFLRQAFSLAAEEMSKTAHVDAGHNVHANPMDDVNDLRIKLEATRNDLMSKLSTSGVIYNDVAQDLCHSVEQELLKGASLGDVSRVLAMHAPTAQVVKEAMLLITEHLQNKGHTTAELDQSFRKVANAALIPNPQHPVVEQFSAFTKIAHGHHVLTTAVKIVDEQLATTKVTLRSMLHDA